MSKPIFVVPVTDLEHGDRDLEWEVPVGWLQNALADTEATPRDRPGVLSLTLSKSGREVVVQGWAEAGVTVPCARTLDPVDLDLRAELLLLLSPAAPGPDARPGGRSARRRRRHSDTGEAPLTAEGAGQDTYDGEQIVLDGFVREHLLLELPMFPLRSDLRSEETAGIAPPDQDAERRPGRAVDPRLAPLEAIAERLRQNKE